MFQSRLRVSDDQGRYQQYRQALHVGRGHSCLEQPQHRQEFQGTTALASTRSSRARSPLSMAVGEGGQPGMWRSTGTTSETPPTTA